MFPLSVVRRSLLEVRLEPFSIGVWRGQTSRFVLVVGGIRTDAKLSRYLRVALQISRQRSSERIQCRRVVPLMCELFTATTRETTDALTSPRATSILPVPTTRNNANRG
ncbi:hypothetical protein AVEN_195495-1 [Araneus ventricosus]|uniref:Uncharacterized protein n=1 Tax=Araneus ventricosus TaxID=182803 RepID=A0A4Y2K383_ARAVE|nr:hypothetical protein AVEN_195495-1 [Araneus ventricosus]